jgi:uncharacterized protein (TIGR01370 family)
MPVISSYALQYLNVNFNALLSSTYDLFITEGAPLAPGGGFPAITDSQVAQLGAQGRTVVGYVNVSVTDDARYYWNPAWTNNGQDTGTPDGDAPSWLAGAMPLNFDGIPGQDALIVNFWDAGWKDIVIDQAVDLVSRGYDGVFLDDVGRYYTLGLPGGVPSIRAMANLMCNFVAEISAAIKAINPNAYVVVNSDPYLTTNVTLDAAGAAAAAAYLAATDAHLLENATATAIDYAANVTLSGETRLILESDGAPAYNFADSWARGILYTTTSYGAAGTFAYPATAGADTLRGGDGPNQIDGLGGNDLLIGGRGADALTGGSGTDTVSYEDNWGAVFVNLLTGAGSGNAAQGDTFSGIENVRGSIYNDLLAGDGAVNQLDGDAGNDILVGGVSADVLIGGSGSDTASYEDNWGAVSINLTIGQGFGNHAQGDTFTGIENVTGGAFGDYFIGDAGANRLAGRAGADTLTGAGGADSFLFDTGLGGGNVDAITDFAAGTDRIELAASIFSTLSPGALAAGAFTTGSGATASGHRIVYNSATGALLYDFDGNGAGAAVQFATLQGAPVITAGDFTII